MTNPNFPNFENLAPEAQDNIQNRVFRVFISSTFIDMQRERERLDQDVFPRFKRRCKERDVEFVPIDFRWGITDDQAKKGRTVGICLSEVRRSTPFFIGLVGERYGWIPKKKNIDKSDFDTFRFLKEGVQKRLSVTEVEFQLAALCQEKQTAAGFWLRSRRMKTPKKFRNKKETSSKRLRRLKDRLRVQDQYPVAEYDSPKDLGKQVEQFLNERLDKYFPEGEKHSWLDKQNVAQDSFERSRKRLYVENTVDYERLNAFVASKEKTLAVVGASGLGKSALLANWKDVCAKNFPDVKIISHYVSASENSDLPANILRRLTESVDPNFETDKEPQLDLTFQQKTLDDFSNEFFATVAQYLKENPERRLLFVVDGLNQLSETEDAKELSWLPDLPEGAQYLLSTVLNDQTFETIKRKDWNRFEIKELDETRLKSIIATFLANRSKTLTDSQEQTILKFPLANNPLVLRTLLEELCVFGIYEKLDAEIKRYAQAKDVNDFFSKVFERLESNRQFVETNPEKRRRIVEKLALLLALARFGLAEEELCRVADLEQTTVSTFLCALDAQLVNRSGRYSYAHEHIRRAVLNRYADKIVETRRLLIDKFLKSIDESSQNLQNIINKHSISKVETAKELLEVPIVQNFLLELESEYERVLYEVPFQYLQLKSWEELRSFLLDFDVLKRLYNYTFNCDFCEYWNAATKNGREEFRFVSYLELNSSEPSNWFKLAFIADKYKEYTTAEEVYQKVIEIQRKLVEENPNANKSEIAMTLNNLAILHKNTNRMDIAEREYKEALFVYRELEQETPKTYLHCIITILNNLAALHFSTNRLDEAEKEYKEALEILRKLSQKNPKVHLQSLAMTLNNLAILHCSINCMEEAEKEYKEALVVRRKLVQENPKVYLKDVATTLNNLAILYRDTSRMDEAEKEYKEALLIYRELARENPKVYLQYVAIALNNLANLHSDTNHINEAEKEYKETLEILRKSVRENPRTYEPYLTGTLNNLATLHFSTNRLDEAEKEYIEILVTYRELARENPRTYEPYVAGVLNNLAVLHKDMNRMGDTEKEYEEALFIYRKLVRENSKTYLPILADTLYNMSLLYYKLDKFTVAEKFASEANMIYSEFAKFSPIYTKCLENVCSLQKNILLKLQSQ